MHFQDQCIENLNTLSRPVFCVFHCFVKTNVFSECLNYLVKTSVLGTHAFVITSVLKTYALSRPVNQVFTVPNQEQ
jgi:hypothetical protein